MSDHSIIRAALGNNASIGGLYDARYDRFLDFSLLKRSIPTNALQVTDTNFSDFQFVLSDDYGDKFHKMDVKAELAVSVLLGLFKLQGCGNYLRDVKKSARTVKCSFVYTIRTKDERVNLLHDELREAFVTEGVPDEVATHVVVGIQWGAKVVLRYEDQNREENDVNKIAGKLEADLNEVARQIKGSGDVDYKDGDVTKFSNFDVQLFGDVIETEGELPLNVEKALAVMKKMPKLLANCNGGKGVPVSYRLIPIKWLQKHINFYIKGDIIFRTLQENTLQRVVNLFDEISKVGQRIYDFHEDVKPYKYCVEDSDLESIYSLQEGFRSHEGTLRSRLVKTLVEVRSGKADIPDLENLINDFQTGQFSPNQVSRELETMEDIMRKINFSKDVISHGAEYIGRGTDLAEKVIQHHSTMAIVWYFNKESRNDRKVWMRNQEVFYSELETLGEGCRGYVVDCDFHRKLFTAERTSFIEVLKNGQVVSEDLGVERERQGSIPFARATEPAKRGVNRPAKAVPLRIPCPSQDCDITKIYNWVCQKCETRLEWGFDGHFYCNCGQTLRDRLIFKCPDISHGHSYTKHDDTSYFQNLLSKLKAFQEINILILGETGVGKSTWINAFANFLTYSNLEDAENGNLLSLIPTKFTVYGKDFTETVVKTGVDNREVLETGKSGTQEATIYTFQIEDTTISIIDTPGIGDVRGIEQDKLNFENILNTLNTREELHGICILLKPNSAKLNLMFRFCIKELLIHLHRDACKNIVFCFTNSRGTFYRPGDTMPALQKLLREMRNDKEENGVEIATTNHNVYCFDSEAYRFLAAVKNIPPVDFSDKEKRSYEESWKTSMEETGRMLEYIRNLTPHPIKSTINLNQTRAIILTLTKPLAEVSRLIEGNKLLIEDEMEDLRRNRNSIETLKTKQFTKRMEIKVEKLDHPKTVCSNMKCTTTRSTGSNSVAVIYNQVCHPKCTLTNITADTVGHPGLLACWAMKRGTCHQCNHRYQEHLHIYYNSLLETIDVEDESIKEALCRTTDAHKAGEIAVASKTSLIIELESESKQIQLASIKFAHFLKSNAIVPYNDEIERYLNHLIREEEKKVACGGNRKVLAALQRNMASYIEERDILEDAMRTEDTQSVGTFYPEDITITSYV